MHPCARDRTRLVTAARYLWPILVTKAAIAEAWPATAHRAGTAGRQRERMAFCAR